MTAIARDRALAELQEALHVDIAAVVARLTALVRGDPMAAAPLETRAGTLQQAGAAFGLSRFERELLLLCAAVELDAEAAALAAEFHRQQEPGTATLALVSRLFSDAHWSALLPTAPLRYWRLIEVTPRRESTLALAPLRLSERMLHHLVGLVSLDEALHPFLVPCAPEAEVPPTHRRAVEAVTRELAERADAGVLLTGCDAAARREVAVAGCAALGLRPLVLAGADIPADAAQRERLARLVMREALLAPAALVVEGEGTSVVAAFAERIGTPLVVSTDDGLAGSRRRLLGVPLPAPTADERRAWWRSALGAEADALDDSLDALAAQFTLTPSQITAAIASAEARTPRALWAASRAEARRRLDALAQRIEADARWDDLVLPPAQLALLRQIGMHVRHRLTVHERWGFGAATRGLGITALFAGPSGTGKTMAAEVLASELALDLYRVDLSQVVSKYIGETEKNLRRVFDAADGAGAILLFDEADALFGQRSEVKDSHDRYANLEVSYLLQRMEAYRGLAILTSNRKADLDQAFLRRLRFVVEFPFPDLAHRAAIWQRAVPAAAPTEGLDVAKLARLNVAGGSIRSIALNAAFLAAEDGGPLRMTHLLQAARAEYAKRDAAPSEAETRDWV